MASSAKRANWRVGTARCLRPAAQRWSLVADLCRCWRCDDNEEARCRVSLQPGMGQRLAGLPHRFAWVPLEAQACKRALEERRLVDSILPCATGSRLGTVGLQGPLWRRGAAPPLSAAAPELPVIAGTRPWGRITFVKTKGELSHPMGRVAHWKNTPSTWDEKYQRNFGWTR
jgi:hypothetical protein